jgi:lysozyme
MKCPKLRYIIAGIIIVVLVLLTIGALFYFGVIWFNNPSKKDYPVRGVDVSSFQGNINWDVLATQDIEFAYIKSSEGSSSVDPKFKYNFEQANKTLLKVGAYHFLSYDTSGLTQAQNFIKNVPKIEGNLPPAIDIEFYGDYKKNPASKEKTDAILKEMLTELEKYYGKKPVIYVTKRAYDLYIKDDFKDYPLWIRGIFTTPKLPDNRKWTFWQYSSRKRLKGYSGGDKYIDMSVFNGSEQEFSKLLLTEQDKKDL